MMKHAQTVRFGFRASLALVIAAVGYLLIRGSEHREPSPIEPEEHSAYSKTERAVTGSDADQAVRDAPNCMIAGMVSTSDDSSSSEGDATLRVIAANGQLVAEHPVELDVGEFSVLVPGPGSYEIEASADGYATHRRTVKAPSLGEVIKLEECAGFALTAERVSSARGMLSDRPPPCNISLKSVHGGAESTIVLAEDETVWVECFADGELISVASDEGVVGPRTLRVRRHGEVRVTLRGVWHVQGVVVDEASGEPIPMVEVAVSEMGRFGTAETDQDGGFSLLVPGGASKLWFSKEGYNSQALLWDVSGRVKDKLKVCLSPMTFVTLNVASGGTPLQGAEVLVYSRTTLGDVAQERSSVSDAEGVCQIPCPTPQGQTNVLVRKPGFTSSWLSIRREAAGTRLTVDLSPAKPLVIRVETAAGEPVPHASVTVSDLSPGRVTDFKRRLMTTASDGECVFPNRPAAGWALKVCADGFAEFDGVNVSLGLNDVYTVVLQEGGFLKFRIVNEAGIGIEGKRGAISIVYTADGETKFFDQVVVTGADGRGEFTGLPLAEVAELVYVMNDRSRDARRRRVRLGQGDEIVLISRDGSSLTRLDLLLADSGNGVDSALVCFAQEGSRTLRCRRSVASGAMVLESVPVGVCELVVLSSGGVARLEGVQVLAGGSPVLIRLEEPNEVQVFWEDRAEGDFVVLRDSAECVGEEARRMGDDSVVTFRDIPRGTYFIEFFRQRKQVLRRRVVLGGYGERVAVRYE